MANDVKIIITAVDRASRELNKVGDSFGKWAAIGGAAMTAISAVGAALKDAVDSTVAYAEAVRDVARATGTGSVDASRLVSVADDLGISVEQLKVGMRSAINEGISPTLDGLMNLADQYQAIEDPVERAQFAMEKFGSRAGLEMQKFLELGREGIAEFARNAVEMTDEATQAARDYELAMDALGDAVLQVKIDVANGLIPALVQLADVLSGIKADEWASQMEAAGIAAVTSAGSYEEYARMMFEAAVAAHQLQKFQADLALQGGINSQQFKDTADSIQLQTQAQWEAARAIQSTDEWTREYNRSLQVSTPAIEDNTAATEKNYSAKSKDQAMTEALSDTIINSEIEAQREAREAAEEHARGLEEAAQKAEELRQALLGVTAATLDLDTNLGSTMGGLIEKLDLKRQGAPALQKAFGQITAMVDLVPDETIRKWTTDLIVAWETSTKNAGMQTKSEGLQNIMDQTGMNWDQAKAAWRDADLQGTLDEINTKAQELANQVGTTGEQSQTATDTMKTGLEEAKTATENEKTS